MVRLQVATEPTQLEIKELVENIDTFAGVTSDPNGVKYRPIMTPIRRVGYEQRTLESIIQEVYDTNFIVDKASDITGLERLPLDEQEVYLVFGLQFISIIDTKTMTLLEHQRVFNNGYVAYASSTVCRYFFDNKFLYIVIRRTADISAENVIGFMVLDKETFKYKTTTAFLGIGVSIGANVSTQYGVVTNGSATWFVTTLQNSLTNWYFSRIEFGPDGLPTGHKYVTTLSIMNQNPGAGASSMGLPISFGTQGILIERSAGHVAVRHLTISETTNLVTVVKTIQIPVGTFTTTIQSLYYTKVVKGKRWYFIVFRDFTFMYNETDGVGGNMVGGSDSSMLDLDTMTMRVRETALYRISDSQVARINKYTCDLDDIYTPSNTTYIRAIRHYPEYMLFDYVDNTTKDGWSANPSITRSHRINGIWYLFDSSWSLSFPLVYGNIIKSYEEVK